jgi:hypothetical protein
MILFLSSNEVEIILYDLDTHILYGADYNYTKDMQQVKDVVLELKKIIDSYKSNSE